MAPGREQRINHLFLSYATADRERAMAVADALESAGIPVWIDRRGLTGGSMWAAEITGAIRSCQAFALLCSPTSVVSRNVRQEIQLAWDHDRPILPLLLEPVEFPDEVAYFLQGRQWIEVRGDASEPWTQQVYRAFATLGTLIPLQQPVPSRFENGAGNLPMPPTAIIGREEHIAAICAVLEARATQLVTLTGPGGVGKTRLALAAAWVYRDTFAGAIQFVNLAAVRDPELVLPTVAEAVGVQHEGPEPLIRALHAALRDQPLLLLLDNCEQVLEAAPVIGELLAELPQLMILATSREPLRLRAEQTIDITPLPVNGASEPAGVDVDASSPAVQLFVARAAVAKPGMRLTDASFAAISEICKRLDGLPLAIELAASRTALLTPERMLSRMEKRLPLLTGGARDLPDRQRTLRDAMAWSEDLLTEEERAVFRRLSVFAGGFTLESAAAVAGSPEGPLDEFVVLQAMERLVAHSLLREMPGVGDDIRFHMLGTIREFAREGLESSGEPGAINQRHAEFFLSLAVEGSQWLFGPEQSGWLQQLRIELDNLRAALAWAIENDRATALRLGDALREFWVFCGLLPEGALWSERVLAAGEGEDPALVAEAAYSVARIAYRMGNPSRCREPAERALALFEQTGNAHGVARAKAALAVSMWSEEERPESIALFTDALQTMKRLGDTFYEGTFSNNLAIAYTSAGDLETALQLFAESAETDARTGNRLARSLKLGNMVETLVLLGRATDAIPALREISDHFRLAPHRFNVGFSLQCFALVFSAIGKPELAARIYGASELEIQLSGFTQLPDETDAYLADVARLRETLGEPAFESAWTAGRAMSYEAAMEMARTELDTWEAETTGPARSI
jgi:predicted ATPase